MCTGMMLMTKLSRAIYVQADPEYGDVTGRLSASHENFADYPVALPDESWPLRNVLDAELARQALQPHVITSSNSVEFLRTMLDQQLGVGFQTIIGMEHKLERGELVLVPLISGQAVVQVFSICVRDDQPQTAPFRRAIELLCQRLEEYKHNE